MTRLLPLSLSTGCDGSQSPERCKSEQSNSKRGGGGLLRSLEGLVKGNVVFPKIPLVEPKVLLLKCSVL